MWLVNQCQPMYYAVMFNAVQISELVCTSVSSVIKVMTKIPILPFLKGRYYELS